MENNQDITILAVPFPAQGHLNQLLHFSLQLSSHYSLISLHFACSPSHIRQAKSRLQGWSSESLQKIRFHDLEIQPFETPPPDPNNYFPVHLIPTLNASLALRSPLASLLRSLSTNSRKLVVVHDQFLPFVTEEAALIPNAEAYSFGCASSLDELCYLSDSSSMTSIATDQDQDEEKKRVLDLVISTKFEGTIPNEFLEFMSQINFGAVKGTGTLFNSCRALESDFLDLLAKVPYYHGKKLFAVGPVNPITIKREAHECLEWLDKQPQDSVVYVSFGSTSTFCDEQITQLAIGLKRSNQRFIWVLRDADRGDIFADNSKETTRHLAPRFEEEIQGIGMVVREWAPQLDILAHPSTGAFMSHCGWNSCMESLSMGVPIIAWPMHSDQPRNAILVANYLKSGIVARDWCRRKKVITGDEIEEVIKRMMAYDEGKETRERAKIICEEIRAAVAEGGLSKADLGSFMAHISR